MNATHTPTPHRCLDGQCKISTDTYVCIHCGHPYIAPHEMQTVIYDSRMFNLPRFAIGRNGSAFAGWLLVEKPSGGWMSLADLKPNFQTDEAKASAHTIGNAEPFDTVVDGNVVVGVVYWTAYDRLRTDFAALSKHNEALKAALDEALEYFEDREDVRDGPSGEQLPNTEMSMAQALRAALALSRGGGT